MKTFLLLIATCLVSALTGYSQQSFAPVGAEWWYGLDTYLLPPPGVSVGFVQHVQSVKDTVVAGTACRKLTVTTIRNNDTSSRLPATFFVYDNTDTVFVFSDTANKFIPLYVFNVAAGDTVCLSGLSDTAFCYVVDSVRMELFDTTHLRSVYTHTLIDGRNYSVNWGRAQPGGNSGWLNKGRYTERLGGLWPIHQIFLGQPMPAFGSLFPATCHHAGSQLATNEEALIPGANLRCYSDATHAIKLVGFACDYRSPLHTGDLKIALPQLRVYPNPNPGVFKIESEVPLPSSLKVRILDLLGRPVAIALWPKGQTAVAFDLSSGAPGVYFILVEGAGASYAQRIVIRH